MRGLQHVWKQVVSVEEIYVVTMAYEMRKEAGRIWQMKGFYGPGMWQLAPSFLYRCQWAASLQVSKGQVS